MKDIKFLAVILIFASFLFLFKLGDMALTDPDESFYAETAKEMFIEGEWITPIIFGQPQFEKPIFYYWLILLSYLIFGVTEFAARFPSVLFGLFGVAGVYFFGRLLYSRLCGFFSALIMVTFIQYLVLARACVTDMVLTVLILYCLLFFIMGLAREKKACFLWSAVMAAFAVLTKGPIGLFIPGMILLLYLTFSKQWGRVKQIPVIRCLLLLFVISLPWYLVVYQLHGDNFINEFFGFHNVTRFITPEHRIGSSPLFYIPVVLGGIFPWTVFQIAGSWNMFKQRNKSKTVVSDSLFLLLWFAVVFLFFSASSTKLVTYIFPLFPALAIVTGRFWERFFLRFSHDPKLDNTMSMVFSIQIVVCVIAAIVGIILAKFEYGFPRVIQGAVLSGVFLILGAVASKILLTFHRNLRAFAVILLSILAVGITVSIFILPVVGDTESSKILSEKFLEYSNPTDLIGGECDHRRGIAYYTNRVDIVDIHPHNALMKFFSNDRVKVWGIIQKKHYEPLKDSKEIKISNPVAEAGKYVLVTNQK